jgi:TPR repeat protein
VNASSPVTSRNSNADSTQPEAPRPMTPRRPATMALPLALTAIFVAIVFLPPFRANPKLVWTFLGIGGFLLTWQVTLWVVALRTGRGLVLEFAVVKSHYVQACVQFSIYLYWGWYWREIYAHLPLIFAQIVFLYVLGALISWTGGRSWRIGFGPLPIILSTNFFMWFRDDWFIFQFLMITTGALGKEFIRWNRDGKKTHIFNPSALGLSVFSLILILTGTTNYTWARELATTIDSVPHIYLMIFLVGLVVQYFFSVTLMTLAATAVLCLLNLAYTGTTGVYYFVNTNISAAVFLGLHLLMTDPSTSPRTYSGRFIFGGLYGLGVFILFGVLDHFGAPVLYSKLLQVPLLNLSVQMIDHVTRTGTLGRLTRLWEQAAPPRRLNLVHMACWAAIFFTMLATGFVGGHHPGNSIAFWKHALAEKKPNAAHGLLMAAGAQANAGSGAANNELGLICMEGKTEGVTQSNARAAQYFSRACDQRDACGCANVAIQYLFVGQRTSDEAVAHALELLEKDCEGGSASQSCFLAGFAYETGRGRPLDKQRAIDCYRRCGKDNLYAIKGLARIDLTSNSRGDLAGVVRELEKACQMGDSESCWYLTYIFHDGKRDGQRDDQRARTLLEQSCKLGSAQACEALKLPSLPPFTNPKPMVVPGWLSAFPPS